MSSMSSFDNRTPCKIKTLFWCLLLLTFFCMLSYMTKSERVSSRVTPVIVVPNITDIVMGSHHYFLNETVENITSLYYRHSFPGRNTSYPLISGDTFRGMADFVYDELHLDDLKGVRPGDVVFVKGDMLHKFFHEAFRFIDHPFVLVTHNSDYSAPAEFASVLKKNIILAWYASNPDTHDPKLFPIPIGLSNTRWLAGNVSVMLHSFANYRKPWLNRTKLLYVNFSPGSNTKHRPTALQRAQTFQNVQIITNRTSFSEYLQHLGDAKFVLSPPGNGLDCHRTWEALLMGAAPVVLTSTLNPLYDRAPVVVLENWSNLTEKYLSSLNFQAHDGLVPSALYARYWRARLRKHRPA